MTERMSMDGAVRSMYTWSAYLLVVGVLLAIVPNQVLSLIGLPETDEVWIRIVGVLALALCLYYFDAARNDTRSFFAATILGRWFVSASLVVLWLTGHPWQLLIFAGLEALSALWTFTAMRTRDAK